MLRLTFIAVWVLIAPASALSGQLEDAEAAFERSDFKKALTIFRPLAEQGNAHAQYRLGDLYAVGLSVRKDDVEAVNWYCKAAKQSHPRAQYTLSAMYDFGRGIPVDHGKATAWLRRAAEQGDADAQFTLGSRYQLGNDSPRSDVHAHMWLSLAAAAYHHKIEIESAERKREQIEKMMTPAQLAEAQRLARAWKPSRGGVLHDIACP